MESGGNAYNNLDLRYNFDLGSNGMMETLIGASGRGVEISIFGAMISVTPPTQCTRPTPSTQGTRQNPMGSRWGVL
jgi:myo-inositol-hexaphosphate 3-phosphohydrolase